MVLTTLPKYSAVALSGVALSAEGCTMISLPPRAAKRDRSGCVASNRSDNTGFTRIPAQNSGFQLLFGAAAAFPPVGQVGAHGRPRGFRVLAGDRVGDILVLAMHAHQVLLLDR